LHQNNTNSSNATIIIIGLIVIINEHRRRFDQLFHRRGRTQDYKVEQIL